MVDYNEVYSFMAGRDCSASFQDPAHNSAYDFGDFVVVETEKKAIESDIKSLMSGSVVLTPAEPAEYDEEGNETKAAVPATYVVIESEEQLLATLGSEILDVETIYNDFKGGLSFAELKAQFE